MPSSARRRLVHAVLPAALAVVFGASALVAQAPDWVPKVDALVGKHLEQPGAVGFSVGIARRGEVLYARAYGVADLEFAVPADAETMFRIGSITKQFTAALILRAVDAQKLTLDDGIERFVPGFPLQGHRVTIRHLLQHSSGIPSYTELGPDLDKVQSRELGHEEVLALVAGKPFDFEPGTDWRYCNTGYYLLSMVLEAVHGRPYAQIVEDELAARLGLARTRHDSNRELISNRAQGYKLVDGRLCNDDLLAMSFPAGAGALLSTGGDLVRWSMALAGGKVVPPASYVMMSTPLVLGDRDTHYGFGLIRGEIAELPCVMHGGRIAGFNSFLGHVPQHDLHVAVIANGEDVKTQALADAIVRTVLDLRDVVAKDLPIPAALRDALAGDYRFEAIGMVLCVAAEGEQLVAKGEGEGQQAFRLMFQGEREFRASFDHTVRLAFDAEGKNVTLHQRGRVATGSRR